MKIEVNLEKKYLFFVFSVILIFVGVVLVFAYNPSFNGGNAAIVGHSADEVNVQIFGVERTSQQILDNFYGKSECNINATELKLWGCPSNSYLYKININANSSCKLFYTNFTLNSVPWCYPVNHPIGGGGPSCPDRCGQCVLAGECSQCSCDGISYICYGGSWRYPAPRNINCW